MEEYTSRSGKQSGVISFALGIDFIKVRFQNKEVYTYSNKHNDIETIMTMHALAKDQLGLATFISQTKPLPDE